MNIVKYAIVSINVLAPVPASFAAQGKIVTSALVDRTKKAAEDGGPNAVSSLYDGSSLKGSVPTMPLVVPQAAKLDAPRVTRVNHLYKPGELPEGGARVLRGRNSLERGYAWTMHPATELLDSDNSAFKVAGFVLGVVLYIPAVLIAGMNYIASNSRLTKGTSWHRHD